MSFIDDRPQVLLEGTHYLDVAAIKSRAVSNRMYSANKKLYTCSGDIIILFTVFTYINNNVFAI